MGVLRHHRGGASIALIILVLVPFIRWRTEHFVITNHHVFFRTGLLSRREHQIPLGQIANMETEVTFWGRLMGYGSLIVESSADQPLKFRNVASLSKVQAQLNQLIRDERERTHRGRDGPSGLPAGLPSRRAYAAAGYQQVPHPVGYPQQGYPAQGGTRSSRATRRQGYSAGLPAARVPAHPGLSAAARLPAARIPRPRIAAGCTVQRLHPACRAPAPPGGSGQSEGRPASQS